MTWPAAVSHPAGPHLVACSRSRGRGPRVRELADFERAPLIFIERHEPLSSLDFPISSKYSPNYSLSKQCRSHSSPSLRNRNLDLPRWESLCAESRRNE